MKEYFVKDLMVPLSEYATVPEGSTLFEAMLALEETQEKFDHTKYSHRSILVLNKGKKVIGKLDISDALSALGPQSNVFDELEELEKLGFSPKFMQYVSAKRHTVSDSLQNLCKKASELKVENFMQAPTVGEYVEKDVPMRIAIHQLVIGDHLTLLVTEKNSIIGILRLTDVFAAVFHTMKVCEHSP